MEQSQNQTKFFDINHPYLCISGWSSNHTLKSFKEIKHNPGFSF